MSNDNDNDHADATRYRGIRAKFIAEEPHMTETEFDARVDAELIPNEV